jgi:hypothetical protein
MQHNRVLLATLLSLSNSIMATPIASSPYTAVPADAGTTKTWDGGDLTVVYPAALPVGFSVTVNKVAPPAPAPVPAPPPPAPAPAPAPVVATLGDFETGNDGDIITPAVLDSAFRGQYATDWITVTDGNNQIPGTTTNLTISTAASFGGTGRGMRAVHSRDGAIQLAAGQTGHAAIGMHWRWNGPQINWSPRDVIALIDNVGGYQYMQATDGPNPQVHMHWQPYSSGNGIGSPIYVKRNHWYWVSMVHVGGGGTAVLRVYDAEAGYTLVGTSSGKVSGSSTWGSRVVQVGIIKYSSGSAQSFDFDNIEINFDGTPVPLP